MQIDYKRMSYKQMDYKRMSYKRMNYQQIEEDILNIPKFRAEGSIEETRKFYEFLGKPGQSASIIHVAGTNGKGSACAYMNSVLTEAGYSVGMFTSPHLVSVRERMRVNNNLISEQEFAQIYESLTKHIDSYNEICKINSSGETDFTIDKSADDKMDIVLEEGYAEQGILCTGKQYFPTFYEFLFFMAMLYFELQNTEIIILETGLGGRLDATNVIDAPKVAVLTEIGKDHMEYLGNTFEEIAAEKAGIIKKESRVVYSGNRQETATVIERKAKEMGALCKCVEKLKKLDYRFVDKKIDFSFFSRYYGYIPIKLNTCAIYQIENAALALTAIEELGIEVSKEAIQRGMEICKWEGRMEEILPGVYLDGAHNEDGIEAFISSVSMDGCKGKRWLLFSAVADKEYILMKEKLFSSGLFHVIYAAPLKTSRGIAKEELEKKFADFIPNIVNEENTQGKKITSDKNIEKKTAKEKVDNTFVDQKVRISDSAYEGLQEILSLKKEEDCVYVTGSLYLVGEIKEQKEKNSDTQR